MAQRDRLYVLKNSSTEISTRHKGPYKNEVARVVADDVTRTKNMRVVKGVLAIAFILLSFNIIQLASQKPIGYVTDIYSILPATLIPSLILCFFIASLAVILRIGWTRVVGIALLSLVLLVILVIPYSLGYHSMGRADDMSYIGEYVHIVRTGHVASWDIYPASPIIGSTISVLTGIEANIVSFIIPVVFTSLFVVGLYIFGRLFFNNRQYDDILLISSFILYLGPYNFLNVPHALFFAFLPIFLLITFRYVQSRNRSYSIMMVGLSLLIPITHPFIFLFVFILFSALLVLRPIVQKFVDGDIGRLKMPILIQLVLFLAWFISSDALIERLYWRLRSFFMDTSTDALSVTTNKFTSAALDPYSLLNFIITYYGRYIIPTVFIFVFLMICYKRIDKNSDTKRSLQVLLTLYLIALAVEIILFVNPIVSHQIDRLSNLLFIAYFQVPLFAFSLLYLYRIATDYRKIINLRKIIVIIVVLVTFGLSLLGTFDSPNINRPSVALTYNEVEGMKWIYENRDGHYTNSPISQTGRFHALLDDDDYDTRIRIPDHFGYNVTSNRFTDIVTNYRGPSYIVIFTTDMTLYEEVPAYKSVGRYSYEDYDKFLKDDSVNRIYSGLNIEISHAHR